MPLRTERGHVALVEIDIAPAVSRHIGGTDTTAGVCNPRAAARKPARSVRGPSAIAGPL
jgi:hypothetical protein